MFMLQQACQQHVRAAHTVDDASVPELDPHRQSIDEKPEPQAVAAAHPPEQHRAEDHILTSRQLPEHLCVGEMEQARGADAEICGAVPQSLREASVERELRLDNNAIALHIDEPEGGRRLADIAQQ